jgi:hypothetical protein
MHRGIAKGAAVVFATAGLIGGGAALANAASGGSSSTPSNTQPSNPAPSATPPSSGSGHHCPHMGSGGNSGSGFGAPQGAPSQAT